MESVRPEHDLVKRECDEHARCKRICVKCETELRTREFAKPSPAEKEEDPDYATEWKAHKDLKVANKAKAYSATIARIQQAKKELREE
eukprot:4840762-Lingulodinium_polyedra.AAC.1